MMVSAASLERERVERAVSGRDAELVAKTRDAIDVKKLASECESKKDEGHDGTITGALKLLEGEIAQLQDEVYALDKALALVSVQTGIVAKDESFDAVKAPDPREVADIPHDIVAKANLVRSLRFFLNDVSNRLRIQ